MSGAESMKTMRVRKRTGEGEKETEKRRKIRKQIGHVLTTH